MKLDPYYIERERKNAELVAAWFYALLFGAGVGLCCLAFHGVVCLIYHGN